MENVVIVAILAAILGLAGWYVYKAKKSGKKCIGCPDGGTCGSCSGGCSSCNGQCGCDHK
jgi:hypothetical protein